MPSNIFSPIHLFLRSCISSALLLAVGIGISSRDASSCNDSGFWDKGTNTGSTGNSTTV
jgi:hypothetical protein